MITRDSKASISGTAQNARQRLGEVMKFCRERRDITTRRAADMCCVSREAYENWEAGFTVPDGKAWDKLCGIMSRNLRAYGELRLRALKEAETERGQIIESMAARSRQKEQATMAVTNGQNGQSKIATNLGEKLGQALAAPPKRERRLPEPSYGPTHAERTSEALKKLPAGWKSTEMIEQRRNFVLALCRQRPNIHLTGADSIEEQLKKTFGCGMSLDSMQKLRERARKEIAQAPVNTKPALAEVPHPTPPSVPVAIDPVVVEVKSAPVRAEATAETSDEDINTAVGLILDAIPGLQTFTITVDEHGEASVDYQIRKVKIETVGGSMKVRR